MKAKVHCQGNSDGPPAYDDYLVTLFHINQPGL